MKRIFIAIVLSFACLAGSALASGEIDASFVPVPSKTVEQTSVAGQLVQPDGKTVIWGVNLAVDSKFGQILRINDNGTVDNGFAYCGCLLSSISKVIRQSDGKLLVSGAGLDFQGRIVRLNANGSQDTSFSSVLGGYGHQSSTAEAISVQPDGDVYATIYGGFSTGFHSGYFVRLNSDGSADTGFTQIGYDGGRFIHGAVHGFESLTDGRIYLAITTDSGIGITDTVLRRYASNGTLDATWEAPTFSGGGGADISDLALQSDGALLVSGQFDSVNGIPKPDFVRILTAGNVDLGFSVTVPTTGRGGEIAVLQNGKILAVSSNKIVRFNTDGSTDGSFANPAEILAVTTRFAVDPAERPVFFGSLTAGGYRMFRLANTGAVDPAFTPNLTILAEVYAQARQSDGKLIIAGTFTQVNGTPKQSVARINPDGTLDGTFDGGTGFSSPPKTLSVLSDGKIVAAGSFFSYNNVSREGVARLNSDGSLDQTFAPIVSSVKGAIRLSDGKVLIYGSFSTVNGVSRTKIAKLNSDGSIDNSVTTVIGSGTVYAVEQLSGGGFIVGGSFSGVDGFNRSNLVRLNPNGSLDQSFNAAGVTAVENVAVKPDGKVIYSYWSPSYSIGRRNIDGSNDGTFFAPVLEGSSSLDTAIYTISLQSDGSLLVGGMFEFADSTRRGNIVRLAPNGSLDTLFLPEGAAGPVRSLLSRPDGKVYAAGAFSAIGGQRRASMALLVPGAIVRVVPFDFDGDGRSDIAVFRPSENKWYILRSSDWQVTQTIFAIPNDQPVAADFDGDGKTDVAIFRPSSGDWWSLGSASGGQTNVNLGASGDIPLPSDITGDGRSDYVVFRPSNSVWYRISSGGQFTQIAFGLPGDKPVIGDVDGDGKAEPVIYRPSTGDWWWQSSIDNVQRAVHWGIASDIPTAADYDGDGKTDFAVYRPADGLWYIRNSSNDSYLITKFGLAEDKPVPADYDGDGRADIAVYRPSSGVWYLLKSTEGFAAYQFGIATDIPVQNAYIPQ